MRDLNDTYLSPDKIMSSPKLIVASMELVASMPLHFLEFLGKQILGRNRMTKWVQVDKKWNQCLKKSAEINTRYSMQTLRTKSLLSHVGLNREVEGMIVGDVVLEVTYTQSHLKGKIYISRKNKPIVYVEETTEMKILDDLDHEPWIMQHLCWLVHTSSYDIIQLGDGAKSDKKKRKKLKVLIHQKMIHQKITCGATNGGQGRVRWSVVFHQYLTHCTLWETVKLVNPSKN